MTEREEARLKALVEFQTLLGHHFSDLSLLDTALTHSSYAHEKGTHFWNERLEFLGDAVLDMLTSEELYTSRPEAAEGQLTSERASLVREEILTEWGQRLGVAELLRVGKGQRQSKSVNMIGDAVEAIIGALYIDGGLDVARSFLKTRPNDVSHLVRDSKSRLQVLCQDIAKIAPVYSLVSREGPEHQPVFTVKVELLGKVLAYGTGSSRKAAEQDAAKKALDDDKLIQDVSLKK